MSGGYWRQGETLDFAVADHQMILVNGQHRLKAQETTTADITWIIRLLRAQDANAVRRLYATFDSVHRMRSTGVVVAESPDLEKPDGMDPQLAVLLWGAVGTLCKSEGRAPVYGNLVTGWNQSSRAIQTLHACWTEADATTRRELRVRPLVAVAIRTLSLDDDQCFWREFFTNSGDGWAKSALFYLLTSQAKAIRGNRRLTTAAKAAVVLNAYLKHRAGEAIPASKSPLPKPRQSVEYGGLSFTMP